MVVRALAATALALGATVVLAPTASAKPPEIPEVCVEFYDPEHAESSFVCVHHFLP